MTTEPAQQQKSSNAPLILTVIAVILLCIVLQSIGGGDDDKPREPTNIDAALMCQQFVTDRLKAPSTAEFQRLSDADVTKDGNTFIVISWVDAQNSFGAMIRTSYICNVEYVGDDRWRLTGLVTDP